MKPGFSHFPTEEMLRAGRQLSPQEIFAWLAEANAFTDRALDPVTRKIWESFRAATPPPPANR